MIRCTYIFKMFTTIRLVNTAFTSHTYHFALVNGENMEVLLSQQLSSVQYSFINSDTMLNIRSWHLVITESALILLRIILGIISCIYQIGHHFMCLRAIVFLILGLLISRNQFKGSLLWQPTPVFLPGKSHGRRSLVGYSPWGCKESDTTEWLHFYNKKVRLLS